MTGFQKDAPSPFLCPSYQVVNLRLVTATPKNLTNSDMPSIHPSN